MIPRLPSLDFTDVPIHWSQIPEFAVDLNASSPVAAQSEPYLNTVMATIRKGLSDGPLHREIGIFIKQEANHHRVHGRLNDQLYCRGYDAVREIEMQLRDDYRKLLKEKSLAFNAAYCAGFENLALFLCKFIFYRAIPYFEGADRRMTDLFLWHYAEEFEHRSVAHDAFAIISGNYFRRIYGALYAFVHLSRYKARIRRALHAVDRAGMTEEQVALSRKRERGLDMQLATYVLPRMLLVLIPFYNPAKARVPERVRATLARFEDTTSQGRG